MKLETEYIPIEELNVWDKNPRLHNLDSIVESIKEFGFRDPISINENNSEIEEGHGRLKALKKLKEAGSEPPAFIIQQNGTWLVPVQRFNDTELNQKRYSLAHNRTQELGGFDEPLLLENLIDLKEDLFATGYTSEDIDLLNEKLDGGYKHSEKDDQVPEVQKIAIAKPGELWILGRHRLLAGDSTKREDVERLMDGKKADMVFTDPPYGMDLDTNYKNIYKNSIAQVRNQSKIIGDDKYFDPGHWLDLFNDIKEQFWWGCDYYFDKLPINGSLFVWDKVCDTMEGRIGNDFELCWSKNKHKKEIIYIKWAGFLGLKKEDSNRIHPTQKPVRLCYYFINKFSKENYNIWDGFLGSGSTLIACEKTNRICYGMEIEPLYIDVIIRRWQDFTGLEATREDGVKFNELI